MTIDEAIKSLTGLALGDPPAQMSNYVPALKLGIEAMKEIKAARTYSVGLIPEKLPGETRE